MFVYVWEYLVAQGKHQDFEREYGPDGAWAAFFSKGSGYLGTSLLRDDSNPNRFLTVDRWDSRRAHSAYVDSNRIEFDAIDLRCEELTESEELIGHFLVAGRAF